MASKKTLGNYVESRKKKYHSKWKFYFHLSNAPRKFLQPRSTPIASTLESNERLQPLLFLTPYNRIKSWLDWTVHKLHGQKFDKGWERLDQGGYITIYVHIVRVSPEELQTPKKRYAGEFVVKRSLRPLAVVPVRYYYYRRLDLAKVSAKVKHLKYRERKKQIDRKFYFRQS